MANEFDLKKFYKLLFRTQIYRRYDKKKKIRFRFFLESFLKKYFPYQRKHSSNIEGILFVNLKYLYILHTFLRSEFPLPDNFKNSDIPSVEEAR